MTKDRASYNGIRKYIDKEGGYSLWVPKDWREIPMTNGHHGVIFTPHKDDFDTSFAAEKQTLPFKISMKDMQIARKGFEDGLASLPEVEIESQDESFTKTLKIFDARVTFVEDGVRRKRWVRTAYWGEGQLTMIAQGATVEEFEYYEGMFYNTMMTIELH